MTIALPAPGFQCVACSGGANVVVLLTRHHVCGRACLTRLHEAVAKIIIKLQQDAG